MQSRLSDVGFTARMRAEETDRRRAKRVIDVRRAIGNDLRSLRLDAGASLRRVAAAAGVSPAHLSAIELGKAEASMAALTAITDVLGADLAIRAYPNTGARLRDRLQAPVVEELLRIAHPRWRRLIEVPVYRPSRGVVDVVLIDPSARLVVADEVESQLHRLEQQVRWAKQKAEALPSADFWRHLEGPHEVSRLLVLRSTRATRELAIRFEETLRAAYPARTREVYEALVGAAAWPGAGILWSEVDARGARILATPPRFVRVGR